MHEEAALGDVSVHVPGRAQGSIKMVVPVLVKGVLRPRNLILEAVVQHLGRHCTQEACSSQAPDLGRWVHEALLYPARAFPPEPKFEGLIP